MTDISSRANLSDCFREGHIFLNKDGIVLSCDRQAAELLNIGFSDLIGKDIKPLILPYFRDEGHLYEFLAPESALKSEMIIPYEPDLEKRLKLLVLTNTRIISSKDGSTSTMLSVVDISRFAEIEEKLQRKIDEFSMLNRVYSYLHGAEKVSDVITATLVAVTAGSGLRFNRALLFIVDKEQPILKGKLAVGPSSPDDASRIWEEIDQQNYSLQELIDMGKQRQFLENNRELTDLCQKMRIPLENSRHFLIKCLKSPHPCIYTNYDDREGLEEFLKVFSTSMIAVAPLHGRFSTLGTLVVDNAVTGQPIYEENLQSLQTFANQAAIAIENIFLYMDLQEKMDELNMTIETLKKNQQQIVRMERLAAIGEITSRLAHEIRNPLASMGGFVSVLGKNLKTNSDAMEYLNIVREEIARLEGIVNNILTFIRPEKQVSEKGDLNEIIRANIYLLAKRIDEQKIRSRIDLDNNLRRINVNDYKITQLIMNLIKNALEAMPEGGILSVSTRLDGENIVLTVSDTGIGIDEESKKQLFEPFFTTKPDGTGLGLSVCYQIVQEHGGTIEVTSNEGKGTTFKICFSKDLMIDN